MSEYDDYRNGHLTAADVLDDEEYSEYMRVRPPLRQLPIPSIHKEVSTSSDTTDDPK